MIPAKKWQYHYTPCISIVYARLKFLFFATQLFTSHRIVSHPMPSSDFILSYKLLNAYSFKAFSPLQILQWNRIANLESRVFTQPYARRICCCCCCCWYCSLKSCSTTSRVHQIQTLRFHIFIFSIYIICTLHTRYSLLYVQRNSTSAHYCVCVWYDDDPISLCFSCSFVPFY